MAQKAILYLWLAMAGVLLNIVMHCGQLLIVEAVGASGKIHTSIHTAFTTIVTYHIFQKFTLVFF